MTQKLLKLTLTGVLLCSAEEYLQAQEHGTIESLGNVVDLGIDRIDILVQLRDAEIESQTINKGEITLANIDPEIESFNTLYLVENAEANLSLPIQTTYQIQFKAKNYIEKTLEYNTENIEAYSDTLVIFLQHTKENIAFEITDIDTEFEDVQLEMVLTNKNRDEKIIIGNEELKSKKFNVALRTEDDYTLEVNTNTGIILYREEIENVNGRTRIRKIAISSGRNKVEPKLPTLAIGDKIAMYDITFEPFSTDLNEKSKEELTRVIKLLEANPKAIIEVGGHTDSYDPYGNNKILSEKRAESVVNFLTSTGIEKDRLQVKGYGASQPIANNNTAEGRAKNRRFELKVVGMKEIK